MRVRKRPVEVDAIRWWPDQSLGYFDNGKYKNRAIGTDAHGVEYTVCNVGLRTLEGFMSICPGDWIITGVMGERYPCKPEIFARTYELVGVMNA